MKKILVIEDEPMTLEIIKKHLSSEGYEVITAVDGFDGIKKIDEHKFNLVITDIMMPKLSGLTVLNVSKEYSPKVPVIFISSIDSGEMILQKLSIEADDFIVKPINLKELSIRIKHLLTKQENRI